ncbi:hypothetical protein [Taklimakanibacter deserti]|uniref:hypothetical protein n=1 Tax=Taklimakanibacter deserti TaxID=2267839 RepID=UPI0013C4B811
MRTLGHWIVALIIAAIVAWMVWTSSDLQTCRQGMTVGASFYDSLLESRRCLGEYARANAAEILAIFTVILGVAIWLMWRATRALVSETRVTGDALVATNRSLAEATQATAEAAKRSAGIAEQVLIATQRPWVTFTVELAGTLAFDGAGASIPLKIGTENIGPTPAVAVLAHPVIFCQEKQPFKAVDVIKRRSGDFNTAGRLGHTLSKGEQFSEVKTAGMGLEEYEGMSVISPFILVTVKYRLTFSDETRMAAKLYSLVRTDPVYQAQSVVMQPGNSVQPDRLNLVLIGSYAD